jgi:hypothetical protein
MNTGKNICGGMGYLVVLVKVFEETFFLRSSDLDEVGRGQRNKKREQEKIEGRQGGGVSSCHSLCQTDLLLGCKVRVRGKVYKIQLRKSERSVKTYNTDRRVSEVQALAIPQKSERSWALGCSTQANFCSLPNPSQLHNILLLNHGRL